MKLLVLGANSLLGQALVDELEQQQIEFQALATGTPDLLKKMDVLRALNASGATQVVNVSAWSGLQRSEQDPAAADHCDVVHSRGISILAEACQSLELPLLHRSTAFVFDGSKTHPYLEEDATNPVSRYGMSLWYGERAIRESLPRHLILRTDWMFGRERPGYFRAHIDACKAGKGALEVLKHRFSPTPARDVARVLVAIARQVDCEADVWGTYHYCSLQPMSQEHFLENFLHQAAKYDPALAAVIDRLELSVLKPEPPFIDNSVLSSQKLFETFGIKQRSRISEINGLLQEIYQLAEMPREPELPTPDKGDIADRQEDREQPPKVRKRAKAAKPARKAARRKASPQP